MKKLFITSWQYLFYWRSQWWNREKLRQFQVNRLKDILVHAGKHVPYYRSLFHEIGFNPSTFASLKQLQDIPTLDKQTVRTRKEEFIADNARQFGWNDVSTSGTTGTPLHLVLSDAADANFVASLIRCYHWAGYRFFKRTLSLQSYYLENKDIEYRRQYNVIRYDSCRLSKESAVEAVKIINRMKPSFFMGFPFDLLMLTRFAAEEGLKIHPPDSVLCYGETLSPNKRQLLKKALGCRIYDFYSHHECVAMVAQCDHGNYHIMDDFAFNEFLNDNGHPVPDGEPGELVGTTLYNYTMPLIRYRTGDRIKLLDTTKPCGCGRGLRTVSRVQGKHTDYLETPDGRVLSTVMSHSMDMARGVVMSQCIQDEVDHVRVLVITDDSYIEESETALIAGLRKRLGETIRIDVEKVDQLVKSKGGKTPFILSEIGNKSI